MRFSIIIFILCLFSFASAKPLERLFEMQAQEIAVLTTAEDVPVDQAKEIKYWVLFNKQPAGFKAFMYKAWKTLLEQKRVKRLTKDVRDKLGIPQLHCVGPVRCSELVAVYMTLSNYILVDYEKLNSETAVWFFHELVHAVQYMYRFPLDIDLLYRLSIEQNPEMSVRPEQLVDYLRFFYENQANWYTLRLGKNEAWNEAQQNVLESALETTGKIALGLGSMTIIPKSMKPLFLELLPTIDHWRGDTVEHMLWEIHEPIVLKNYHAFNPGIHVDVDFFRKLTRAVEQGYFGELEFLYQKNNGDQKIYRDLNNNFYESNLLTNDCSEAIDLIKDDSPFLNWLTIQPEKIPCPAYRDLKFWDNRLQITGAFDYDINKKYYQPGTRGGKGPGLNILPYAQPQLLVWPE